MQILKYNLLEFFTSNSEKVYFEFKKRKQRNERKFVQGLEKF